MSTDSIKQQLQDIPLGTYLMAHGDFDNSTNQTIVQGTLKSFDLAKGTMVLHSTNYDRDRTVELSKVAYIDDKRTGSGALGSAQAPDAKQVAIDRYKEGA